jgi:hypothetical protein
MFKILSLLHRYQIPFVLQRQIIIVFVLRNHKEYSQNSGFKAKVGSTKLGALKNTENKCIAYFRNRDSSVGIATVCGLDGPSSFPGCARFFSSPERPDRLWGTPKVLSNGYRNHIKYERYKRDNY